MVYYFGYVFAFVLLLVFNVQSEINFLKENKIELLMFKKNTKSYILRSPLEQSLNGVVNRGNGLGEGHRGMKTCFECYFVGKHCKNELSLEADTRDAAGQCALKMPPKKARCQTGNSQELNLWGAEGGVTITRPECQ